MQRKEAHPKSPAKREGVLLNSGQTPKEQIAKRNGTPYGPSMRSKRSEAKTLGSASGQAEPVKAFSVTASLKLSRMLSRETSQPRVTPLLSRPVWTTTRLKQSFYGTHRNSRKRQLNRQNVELQSEKHNQSINRTAKSCAFRVRLFLRRRSAVRTTDRRLWVDSRHLPNNTFVTQARIFSPQLTKSTIVRILPPWEKAKTPDH